MSESRDVNDSMDMVLTGGATGSPWGDWWPTGGIESRYYELTVRWCYASSRERIMMLMLRDA